MEIKGDWYFPELDRNYPGILFKNKSIIKLQILGGLPKVRSNCRFPVVYGNTTDGPFTLINCVWNNNEKYNNQSEIAESRLMCQSIIRYYCFEKEQDLKFNEFKFNFAGLREWCNISNVDEKFGIDCVDVSFKNPGKISFQINDEFKGEIAFEMDTFPTTDMSYNAVYQIRHSAFVKIISNIGAFYKDFIELRNKIFDFFHFAINYKIEPYIQRFYKDELVEENTREKLRKELVFIQKGVAEEMKFPEMHFFPFKYTEVKGSFDIIIKSWVEKYEKLKPITNIFIYFFSKESLSIENKFLLVSQAMETFHARFRQGSESYENRETNRFGTPLFNTRIIKLIEYYDVNVNQDLFDNEETNLIAENLKNTRDYYTHYLENLEDSRWDIPKLLTYTPKLIAVLHSLILLEINIPVSLIKEFISRGNFSSYNDIEELPVFGSEKK